VARQLMEGKIYRAVLSNRQLEEVLTDFWFNHFNVYLRKGADRYLVTSYERDAIRPHVLGKFQDMLLATARHPAMLFYLDNWQSMDPQALENLSKSRRGRGSPQVKQLAKRVRGLNENYGRELLELHTLGVDGGYTQQDVVEVARCFTGWSIRNPRQGGDFQFLALLHDRNEKTVLGHKISAGGGEQDGRRVIEILSRHPSTARFISTKLAQRFVTDQPPKALVDRMAATFLKTDGDLREVMRTMLSSREFFSRGAYQAKMKSPLEMVVSSVRALNADSENSLCFGVSHRGIRPAAVWQGGAHRLSEHGRGVGQLGWAVGAHELCFPTNVWEAPRDTGGLGEPCRQRCRAGCPPAAATGGHRVHARGHW